jgi:transglutaminase/protease-like cytokinesis protein 3
LKKQSLIAAITLLAVALAGCGSSTSTTSSAAKPSSSTTSSSTTTTSSTSSPTSTSTTSGGGSGGGFKAAFAGDKAQFAALGANLQKALSQAGTKTDAQLATELSALGDQAKAQAQRLSNLSPPPKYKKALDNLVKYLNNVASDLKQISDAAVKHDAAAAKAATKKLVQDAKKVKAADTSITSGLGLPPG